MIRDEASKRAALDKARAIIRDYNREKNRQAKAKQREREKSVGKRTAGQRQPRERDREYLHWLHYTPCIAGLIEGGCQGNIQAAHQKHIGQQAAALGKRPHDRHSCALCEWHHTRAPNACDPAQRKFWDRLGVDVTAFCADLYQAFQEGTDGADVVIHYARSARK